MKPAIILLIALSQQGYWIGGQPNTITVRWPLKDAMPEVRLHWTLAYADDIVLAAGSVNLPADGTPAEIELVPPTVRTRIALSWSWQVRRIEDEGVANVDDGGANAAVLAEGERTIHLFPDDQLETLAEHMRGGRVMVWDEPTGLPAVLEAAGVEHVRIDSRAALAMREVELLLVGPDQLDRTDEATLRRLAQSGASVLILPQTDLERLGEFDLLPRSAPETLRWQDDHPLLAHFERQDLASLLTGRASLHALEVPADAPALALVHWPTEVSMPIAAPQSSLLVVQTLGKGRLIYCQLPIADWQRDPRSRQVLINALDYMRTRAAPTPSLAERTEWRRKAMAESFPGAPSQPDRTPASLERALPDGASSGDSP